MKKNLTPCKWMAGLLLLVFYNEAQSQIPISGIVNVGASYTIKTPFDALDTLISNGITGSVIINLEPGSYVGNLLIPEITGVSDTNTITFKSQTGDSADVSIQSISGITIEFVNSGNIVFKNLTIEQLSNDHAIGFRDNCNHILFNKCIIKGFSVVGSASTYATIGAFTANGTDISFSENHISRGSYGIYLSGDICGLRILDNVFEDPYTRGVYLNTVSESQVTGNIISIVNTIYPSSYGISLNNCRNILINRNMVISKATGISIENSTALAEQDSILLINNIVHTQGSRPALQCVNNTPVIAAYYNTLYSRSGTLVQLNSNNLKFSFLNNLLYRELCGTLIDVETPQDFTWDHNAYFVPCSDNDLFIFEGIELASLNRWQEYSGYDSSSVFADPKFRSPPDELLPLSGAVANIGTPLTGIVSDIITGNRHPEQPDPGAVEFDPAYVNDVWLQSVDSPATPGCEGLDQISVTLKNIGTLLIDSMKIAYAVNGLYIDTVGLNIYLKPFETLSTLIALYDFDGVNDSLTAEIIEVNGVSDEDPSNNLLEKNGIYAPLSGEYTFGGQQADFDTLPQLIDHLNQGGVCGPVTILFRDGIYTGGNGFYLESIPGTNSASPVSFRSENGDPEKVIFRPASFESSGFIHLNNSHDITFSGLTFDLNDLGCAVFTQLDGDIGNIAFENNIIIGDSADCSDIFYASYSRLKNIVISNNRISGSASGVSFDSNLASERLVIHNNSIEGSFEYDGIFVRNFADVEISDNYLYSEGLEAAGLQIRDITGGLKVWNNIIILDSTDRFGLGIYDCYGTPGNSNLIYNNYIYVGGNSDSYTGTGVNLENNYITSFVNNTVYALSLKNTEASAASILGGADVIANNNFINTNGGAMLVLDKTAPPNVIDNNNYNGGYFVLVDEILEDKVDSLDQWQQHGYDLHSFSADPMFKSEKDFHICAPELNNAGIAFDFLTPDIDGNRRSNTHPDIGADEYSLFPEGTDIENQEVVELCAGSVMLATDINADTYLWNTGDTTQYTTVTTPGYYTVEYTGGCGTDGTDTLTVVSPPSGFNVIISGKSALFSFPYPPAPAAYLWEFGDGTTSTVMEPTHIYTNDGEYTVRLTIVNDCGTNILSKVITTGITELDETILASYITLYPNPASNEIILEPSDISGICLIRIMDLTGRTVTADTYSISKQERIQIDVSQFPDGIYILHFLAGNEHGTLRFVKH